MKQQEQRLRNWLENGKKRRSTHVIIAYNNAERDFCPIYISGTQNIQTKLQSINNDYKMKAVEVYNLSMDINNQMLQARCWNT